MSDWHIDQNGQRSQMTLDNLTAAIGRGEVRGGDLVWRDGMPNWLSVAELPVLAAALPAGGPPAGAVVGVVGYQQPRSDAIFATEAAITSLRKTKPWVRFIAVLGFILSGVLAVAAIGISVTMSRFSGGAAAAVLFGYGLFAAINFALAFALNRYATNVAVLIAYRREDHLEAALAAQHRFWRLLGITTLTVISLYLLIFVVAMVISALL